MNEEIYSQVQEKIRNLRYLQNIVQMPTVNVVIGDVMVTTQGANLRAIIQSQINKLQIEITDLKQEIRNN